MEDENLLLLEIIKRLDIVINLLLELQPDTAAPKTMRAKIERLSNFGLGPSEIGRIIAVPTTSVGAQLSQIKQKKKTTKK